MERMTTRELYNQLQDRIITNLEDNQIVCPECKNLRFVYIENNGTGHIETCRRCYNGRLYTCEFCGKNNKTSHCDCKESNEKRHNDFLLKRAVEESEHYKKAEKVHYTDYKGKYIINDYIKDQDNLEEWIYEKLFDGEDVPDYMWEVEGIPHMSIDLLEVITDKCEDGYDDMYSHLNTKSPLLTQAQELINQWEREQGESLYVYGETYRKAVIIKDLVDKIRKEIESK